MEDVKNHRHKKRGRTFKIQLLSKGGFMKQYFALVLYKYIVPNVLSQECHTTEIYDKISSSIRS